jgi:hypothetical protein
MLNYQTMLMFLKMPKHLKNPLIPKNLRFLMLPNYQNLHSTLMNLQFQKLLKILM